MAEMINKWAVVDKLTELENEFQHYKPFEGFEHAMYRKLCETEIAIGKLPGLDVVLCKDCKFGEMCSIRETMALTDSNGYCCRGERRTDGGRTAV